MAGTADQHSRAVRRPRRKFVPGLIDGEKRNVSHYDDALKDGTLPATARDLLQRQRRELETAILGMQAAKS